MAASRYSPPTKYKCTKCAVYTAPPTACSNCGAARTGKEKKL